MVSIINKPIKTPIDPNHLSFPAGVEVYGREWGYRFTEEECSGVVECYLESWEFGGRFSRFAESPTSQRCELFFFLGMNLAQGQMMVLYLRCSDTFAHDDVVVVHLLLLLLSLLLLQLPVEYFTSNTYAFKRHICAFRRPNHWYLRCFCSIKDEHPPKHGYLLHCVLANA